MRFPTRMAFQSLYTHIEKLKRIFVSFSVGLSFRIGLGQPIFKLVI